MNFLPKFLQRFVVVALLGVWFSPAVSAAVPVRSGPLPTFATAPSSPLAETRTSQLPNATTTNETQSYAEREKQATELEQFQGGFYLYIGGGALLLLIIVLLLVL
jgi:hypothetical protein